MTTNIAEKLNRDIEKSVSENVQSAFSDSLETMKQQIDENRSAVKDLGKRLSDSQELQQLIEKIDKAYSDIEGALDKARQSASDGSQGQQSKGQQSQSSRKR